MKTKQPKPPFGLVKAKKVDPDGRFVAMLRKKSNNVMPVLLRISSEDFKKVEEKLKEWELPVEKTTEGFIILHSGYGPFICRTTVLLRLPLKWIWRCLLML